MSETTTNFYYDITEARLVVGDDAYKDALESGVHTADIIPLRTALLGGELSEDLDVTTDAHPTTSPDLEGSTTELVYSDLVSYVAWIGCSVIKSSADTRITDGVLRRAYQLGLGPSVKRLSQEGLSRIYAEAGVPNTHRRGLWDNWTRQQIGEYVASVARTTPKNHSLRNALNQASREDGTKPSSKVVSKRTGSLGNALELAGLFDFQRMDREGYIDWGVKFYLANDGIPPDRGSLDYLSPLRLSPSRSAITRNFGSMESFRLEVEPLFLQQKQEKAEHDRKTFNTIMQSLADGTLPATILREADSLPSMAQAYGIYQTIEKLAPQMPNHRKLDIAQNNSVKQMVTAILKAGDGAITAADIEEAAEIIGVFDYLWPTDSYMKKLRLPQRL